MKTKPVRVDEGRAQRVLIAGCGDVGILLAERLLARGCAVWGLRRNPRDFPAGLVPICADLCDRSNFPALPPGLDSVAYCAAPGTRNQEVYRSVYVDGLANVLDALRAQSQPVRRVIFASSTAVYRQRGGEWIDESSPAEPVGFAGETMLEAESLLRDAPCAHIAVRFGAIYGPGRRRLLDQVRAGKATYAKGDPLYTNRIHREDCAGVLEHLLFLTDPEECYLGVDGHPVAERELLGWLAGQLGAPPPAPRAGDASSPLRAGSKRCSNERLLESGYVFKYPSYREGFAEQLAAVRSEVR